MTAQSRTNTASRQGRRTRHADPLVAARAGLALAALLGGASATWAAAGSLDPSFGSGGLVLTDLGDVDRATGTAVQSDGRILVVGDSTASPGAARFALVRYESDGTLDPTFGTGGIVLEPSTERAECLALQDDGRILVGGSIPGVGTDLALARFHADGTLDPTFGSGGIVTTDVDVLDTVHAVALQPDGRIVVAGGARDAFPIPTGTFVIARHLSDGSLDPTFGTAGVVATQVQPGILINATAYALVVLPDGKILAAGSSETDIIGSEVVALVRYQANGALDPTFGTGGIVTAPTATRAFDAVVQPDGAIVAAGANGGFGPFDMLLARYTTGGAPDVSLGGIGRVTTSVGGGASAARAVVVQTDGRIVVAGYGGTGFALVRHEPDGSLDATFGAGGIVTGGGGSSGIMDIALDAAGALVAVGSDAGDLVVARYLTGAPAPSPSPTLVPEPLPTRTPGALGPRQRCQRAVAKESSRLVKATMRARETCEERKLAGKHADDCPDPDGAPGSPGDRAAALIARAESKFHAKIGVHCGGADRACGTSDDPLDMQVDVAFPVLCPSVDGAPCASAVTDCGGLAACVACLVDHVAGRSIELQYGHLEPVDAAAERDLHRCQVTLANETTRLLVTKEQVARRCWDRMLDGHGPAGPGSDAVGSIACPDADGTPGLLAQKAAQKIARLQRKSVGRICGKCGGASRRCDGDVDTGLIIPGGPTIAGEGTGDDLLPAVIGAPAACPAVVLPFAPHTDCGILDDVDGAPDTVDTLRELVLCLACVTAFRTDCVDRGRIPDGWPTYAAVPATCDP